MASPLEIDVAALAGRATPDPILNVLVERARAGLPTPLTVIVAGTRIDGVLTDDGTMALRIDQHVEKVVSETVARICEASGGPLPPEHGARIQTVLGDTMVDRVREAEHSRDAMRIEVDAAAADPFEPAELPDNLGARAIRDAYRSRHVTLAAAVVNGRPVGTIRVDVDHIAAWWPLEATDDADDLAADKGD